MRNIAAEKKFLETFYLWIGVLFFVGVIVSALGAELWLISSYENLGLPIFLTLQGIWCVTVALVLSFVATVVAKELHLQ